MIIDTLVSSAEGQLSNACDITLLSLSFEPQTDTLLVLSAKWLKQSGLVILLPHGLDGAGPEHSSMRIERFLQVRGFFSSSYYSFIDSVFKLTNDSYEFDEALNINITIANPTTPAQYFHILRRQQLRNYRKPLVIATPKGLLRAPVRNNPCFLKRAVLLTAFRLPSLFQVAASNLDDFAPGSKFQPVLIDPIRCSSPNSDNLKRIIFCSGKIYYDLVAKREERGLQANVALLRLEELAPFPWTAVDNALNQYLPSDERRAEIVWVQEEPRNQGSWSHVSVRLENLLARRGFEDKMKYVGRPESSVPAVGIGELFQKQKAKVLEEAFTLTV